MKKPAKKAVKKVAKKTVKAKRPAMSSHNGYGIVNPYGDMWTSTIFPSAHQAREHLRDFWSGVKGHDLSKYRIVWARQSAHYIREAAGSAA